MSMMSKKEPFKHCCHHLHNTVRSFYNPGLKPRIDDLLNDFYVNDLFWIYVYFGRAKGAICERLTES